MIIKKIMAKPVKENKAANDNTSKPVKGNKTANNTTELVFILDRSGSMSGLEKDTIGGFNSLIEKQKKQEGLCFVTTVLFDHELQIFLVLFSAEALDRAGSVFNDIQSYVDDH